jgi:uncharacterized membrane protein YfcA
MIGAAERRRRHLACRVLKQPAMLLPVLALASLVGLSLGLLGGGGSILTLPILKYVVGMEAHAAVAASLFVVGVTSLAALWPHARSGRVVWRTGLVFGAASMLGAFAAGRVAKHIPAGVLLVLFALMMVVTAVAMLRKRAKCDQGAHATPLRFSGKTIAKIAAEGLAVGAVTGLVGAGGGFLVVPALALLGGLPMSAAIGTSLLVIALKSFAGFAGHLSQVHIEWPIVLAVSGIALAGSLFGARLAGRIEPAKLRRTFGWFVVVMGVFMLAQELPPLFGLAAPIGVAIALAALAAGTAVGVERLLRRRRTSPDPSANPDASLPSIPKGARA